MDTTINKYADLKPGTFFCWLLTTVFLIDKELSISSSAKFSIPYLMMNLSPHQSNWKVISSLFYHSVCDDTLFIQCTYTHLEFMFSYAARHKAESLSRLLPDNFVEWWILNKNCWNFGGIPNTSPTVFTRVNFKTFGGGGRIRAI